MQKKTFTKWVNKHLIKVSGMCAHVCACMCAWLQALRRLWAVAKEGALAL